MTPSNKQMRYHIITFGCQMNVHDSEKIAGILNREHFIKVEDSEDADIIIFNTCSVRKKAEEKFFTALGRIKKLKNKKNIIIAVGGCTAQVLGEEIFNRAPYVDIVFGPRSINRILSNIKTIIKHNESVLATLNSFSNKIEKTQGDLECDFFNSNFAVYDRPSKTRAYTTIMEGCDNHCAYCIVPYARGFEIYRPYKQIIGEIRNLAEQGYIEVILLGQNVNSYKEENITFSRLLQEVSKIQGLHRIRFITSHPAFFNDDIIEVMSTHKKIVPQIHLPLQSGSNAVLEHMNRKYTIEKYMDIVDKLKYYINNISLSTDIIVGFPGESEYDFQKTMDAIKKIEFEQVFSFKYSPRPFTAANTMHDDVSYEVKKERLITLQDLQRKIQIMKNKEEIGKTMNVLVDGFSRKDKKILSGRTESNKIVNFKGPYKLMDKIIPVEIIEATQNSLIGRYSSRVG